MELKEIIRLLVAGILFVEALTLPTYYQPARDPFADLAQGLGISMNNMATNVFASASSHGVSPNGHSVRAEAVASSSSTGGLAPTSAVAYAHTSATSTNRRRARPTRPARLRRPTRQPSY